MGELIAEVVVGFLSIAVGFALGSLVFVLVRGGRWALLRSERATPVTDPTGGRWTVRIPLAPTPMRFWASKRMLGMRADTRRRREEAGASPDEVVRSELAHPRTLVDKTDEAAPFVAVAMLSLVVLSLMVFLLEAIVVAMVAVVVAAIRLAWGRWQCEVITPDGRSERVNAGSLSDARARSALAIDSIKRRGSVDELLA